GRSLCRQDSSRGMAMADFRFACSHCGQRISCDSEMRGRDVTCPSCQAALTVPAPAPRPPPPRGPRAGSSARISGFAIASLVSSCFLTLGCIPGIVCGHMAKARIRSNPALLGNGMANAGLIVGYIALAGSIIFLAMNLGAHIGISTVIRKESDEIALM